MPGPATFPVAFALKFILIGMVVSSIGFCGGLCYFIRTGRLSIQHVAAVKVVPSAMLGTHLVVLDPLLVNLSGDGGSSYLRLSLALRVADMSAKDSGAKDGRSNDDAVAALRDTTLTVLGQQTADDLLATGGKERLKLELKRSLAKNNGSLKITNLFFTDFLVQR